MGTRPFLRRRRPLAVAALVLLAAPFGAAGSASAATDPATAAAATTPAAGTTPATPAVRVDGPSGPDLSARATSLADQVVSRWAAQQLPDGRFPDPVYGGGGDYGTAMLGYAMLRRGAQQGDKGLIRGGLDALTAQVDIPAGGAFELLVLARAYHWAAGALPDDPIAGPIWAKYQAKLAKDLSTRGTISSQSGSGSAKCYSDARCYNNLKLVSSLASIELLGTGLSAGSTSSLLADVGLRGRVLHRASSRVPLETGSGVTRVGGTPVTGGGLLSDPPRDPLAYHALSTMMLGELNAALGDDVPKASQRAFGRAARGLLALAAPDGDLSWFGRGQGQVWVPAVVADAAAQAAAVTTSASLRGRFLALAEASLTRLKTLYGIGPAGFPLVPGAIDGEILLTRGVDSYATTRGYNGLAVDALDRASAVLQRVEGTATDVPSTLTGISRSPNQAGVATLTKGSLWVAVAGKSRAPEDARYGSGLLSMEHRDPTGAWSAIVPGRPLNPRIVSTVGVRQNGQMLVPSSQLLPGVSQTTADFVGGWARPGKPDSLIDSGTTWHWSLPDPKTAQVVFRARIGRTIVMNGLVGDGSTVRKTPFGFIITRPDGVALQYSLGVPSRRLALQRARRDAGASAYDSALGVAQVWAQVRRGEQVTIRIRLLDTAPVVGGG
jgi:hypothetical protein